MTDVLLVPENWQIVWWGDSGVVRMPCPMPGCGAFSLYRDTDGGLLCQSCGETDRKKIQAAFNAHAVQIARATAADAETHREADALRKLQRKGKT